MSDTAAVRTDRELQMLVAMVDCAYELGVAFADAAKAEADGKRKLQLFEAFNRGFLAVRMGIRLSLTLRAPPKPISPARDDAPEVEPAGREPLERAEIDRIESEREREREYEPVSLPRFLATLGVVAADAGRQRRPAPCRRRRWRAADPPGPPGPRQGGLASCRIAHAAKAGIRCERAHPAAQSRGQGRPSWLRLAAKAHRAAKSAPGANAAPRVGLSLPSH